MASRKKRVRKSKRKKPSVLKRKVSVKNKGMLSTYKKEGKKGFKTRKSVGKFLGTY